MGVNDPSEFSGLFSVGMNPFMAWVAHCREIFVTAKPLTNPARLVVNLGCLATLAAFALWVEGKIRLFLLGVLIVFVLAFWGCSPQPA